MSNSYEELICSAIDTIVDSKISKAGFDKTIQAQILSCIDESIGQYKCKYQDSEFYAYAADNSTSYTKNTLVYILVPNNDFSKNKTIIGAVNKMGVDYITTQESGNNFENNGLNCIKNSNTFELCSYKKEVKILYNVNDTNNNLISINNTDVNEYIKNSEYLYCGAKVKTTLPIEQQFRGNFGIVFELSFYDNATESEIIRNYVIDTSQMEGNPYKMSIAKKQSSIFEIDNKNFKCINKIYLFVKDFIESEEDKDNDIFISDLTINGVKKLEEEELSSYCITFTTPQGIYFDTANSQTDKKTIEAKVRIKGKNINNSSQKLEYYWFKENVSVMSNNSKYSIYGGQGWECLNSGNVIHGDYDITEWNPGDYILTIQKKDCLAKENKYKCVAVYNDIIIEKEIIIKNLSSSLDISVMSDAGTEFYFDNGSPNLTCLINGEERTNLKYVWIKIDSNNNYSLLEETIADNKAYNDALTEKNQIEDNIKNGVAYEEASKARLQVLNMILKSYNKKQRIEKNKIFNVAINEIDRFSTFKCSVYSASNEYYGTGYIILNNNLNTTGEYSLVINNGSQIFKYNENGIAPTVNTENKIQTIQPLSFDLFNNKGEKIEKEILEKCSIEWKIPKKLTLLSLVGIYDEDDIEEDDDYYYIKNLTSLSFNILKSYDYKKIQNDIEITVNYKDIIFSAQTNFTFTKDGNPGTNGTDYYCRIVPKTNENIDYPMIFNGELNYQTSNGIWFDVELWENGEQLFKGNTSDETFSVEWSILKNTYSASVSDESALALEDKTIGKFSYNNFLTNSPANIVKCFVKYNKKEFYATLPIITAISNNENLKIKLKENTGFNYVTYSSSAENPKYNDNSFEIEVKELINGYYEDISNIDNDKKLCYNWSILGQTKYKDGLTWKNDTDVKGLKRKDRDNLNEYIANFKPIDIFDNECVTNAILCIVTRGNIELKIHIPVHFYLNRYGNSNINGWDGNSIKIDDNNGGCILAPQVGAGRKDNGLFTGLLMGEVKESGNKNSETGIFGYSGGERTIFLDAETGKAIFGKSGKGQIIFNPVNNTAKIQSGNYKTGENGAGMMIDFTNSQIKFGSGNFSVDANGKMTCNNAFINGDIVSRNLNTGVDQVAIRYGMLDFYDPDSKEKILIGRILPTKYSDEEVGISTVISFFCGKGKSLVLGSDSGDGSARNLLLIGEDQKIRMHNTGIITTRSGAGTWSGTVFKTNNSKGMVIEDGIITQVDVPVVSRKFIQKFKF